METRQNSDPADPQPSALARRIVRGVLHTLTSTYAGRLVNLAAGVMLMHLLDPKDFGRIAFALSVVVLITALRNLGLQYALIHQHDRVHDIAPTHFVLNTSLAVLSTVIVAVNLTWLVLGASISSLFRSARWSRVINVAFAVMLVLSVMAVAFL